MRKQQAIFNRSPTKEFGLSPLGLPKNRLKASSDADDEQALKTLQSISERNFAMSLQLIDCSKGQAETDKLKTSIWSQSKFRNNIAARIMLEPTKELQNEFYLTFDLGSVVQISEVQVTFNISNDMYNQPMHQSVKPQLVIVEGKKETMFVSSKQRSTVANADADSEKEVASRHNSQ